jgi:hypothetical protein
MDRWTRIALLVEQRARSFDYLKQVHQGDMHWLSAVTLGPQDAALSRSVESLQVLRWFYLGVSLGPLLQLPSGPPFVRALLQLFEEFQYHFARSAVQNMKIIKSRGSRAAAPAGGSSEDDLRPQLQRMGGEVLYAYLLTPHIAHPLSASQVLQCLCELMPHAYRKLGEPGAEPPSAALVDAVLKIDTVVEEQLISVVVRQYNATSQGALQSALSKADPLFARLMVGSDAPADGLE